MEKRGTPEFQGTCDVCGEEAVVIPLDENEKVASKNTTTKENVCEEHMPGDMTP